VGLPASWQEVEAGGWSSTWTRRPGSNVYDAYFTDASGQHHATTVNVMTINGNQVTIQRTGSSNNDLCIYRGTLSGNTITGTRTCANGAAGFQMVVRATR
jgi:hypothetical protein